uniref:DUF6589 domain-containing protein n=1 Tax=Amphimedon queenslandica TaxID=400682 RepID=A0A1X7UBH7_AMPQE
MSLFQKLISMILYTGHTGTKVYDQLSKLMFCLGKTASYNWVTLLGSNYDATVRSWMMDLVAPDTEVSTVNNATASNLDEHDYAIESESDDDLESESDNESMKSSTDNNINTDTNKWNGFKLVGDNLDKNIKRRHTRIDQQTISFHGFHYYAVRDRVNLSTLSDIPKPSFFLPVSQLPINSLFPSRADDQTLEYNFAVHISRVLVEELAYFSNTFDQVVTRHIGHPYSKEMAQKSDIVPLGIMNKNENMTEEMIEILEEVHKYVPTRQKTVADDKSGRIVSGDLCHTLLIGGDQLTRKRIKSARDMRRNGKTPHSQLTGLMPVCEDWHTKGIFLEV